MVSEDLKKFLDSLKEEDFKGTKTNKIIQKKAEKFLNSFKYTANEVYKGYDVHNSLLCLLKDQI